VYSYATTGGEHIDAPGGNRPFPATTNITVETNGCGVTEKWDASTQHSETRQLCLHHGDVRLASFATTVKYLGFGSTNSYTCGSDAIVFSPDGKLGQASTVRCTSKDSTADLTVTPVRFQPLEVDGTSVRTLKVTVTSVLSGANQGHSSQQLWFTTDDSVLVKNTGTVDAKQGGVDYHEQYGLMLNHLTPSR
jgi:hypothetical protein